MFELSMAYRMTLSQKEKYKSVGLIIPGQKELAAATMDPQSSAFPSGLESPPWKGILHRPHFYFGDHSALAHGKMES